MPEMKEPDPVGRTVPDWQPATTPKGEVLTGHHVILEPLSAHRHAALLYDQMAGDHALWTYIAWGPFDSIKAFHTAMDRLANNPAYSYYALCDAKSLNALGIAAYMNITPTHGVVEVGGIVYSSALQQDIRATEAMILMMRWAFDNGYRRYEWKCNALNRPSRRAAQRLGFSYEGVFRNHMVVKGHNRDTAWFSITDQDWPALRAAYDAWLSSENFDADGRQKTRLSDLTGPLRVASDPAL